MKTKLFISGMFLTAALTFGQTNRLVVAPGTPAVLAAASTNDLVSTLQRGLFEEEGNRDLDAAISAYQSLAAQFDKSRQVAATAIFRLGECYRKLGRTNEAVAQYDRIVREFSDQQTLATLSRQNIAGLGVRTESSPSTARLEQGQLLAKQIELAEQDLIDQKKRFEVGAGATQADVRAAEREVLRLRQQLAALQSNQPELLDLSRSTTDDEEKEIRRIQALIQNSPDLINAPRAGVNGDLTPLASAVFQGQLRVAQYLLDHGADVNLRVKGSAPLNRAALEGNKAMIELLLNRGADLNTKDNGGRTALHTASQNGFEAVAETLIVHKADVNAADAGGSTPLHLAAERGNIAILKMLLAAGATVNVEDTSGQTPLSYAALNGGAESVKTLLDAKADPNAGKLDSPLLCAVQKRNIESAELLLKAGANPNALSENDFNVGLLDRRFSNPGLGKASATPLWLAASQKQLALVKLLLQFKADPNDTQTDGSVILFQALQNPEILTALLDAGGKIDSRLRGDSNAPLICVASWGSSPNPAVVELLLKRGANPNETAGAGNTPLHYLMMQGGSRNRQIIELLFAYHADPNVENKRGETPLDLAKTAFNGMRMSPAESADLLRAHGALDDLPDYTSIRVTRQGLDRPIPVFHADTNGWNRFTLMETIPSLYSMNSFWTVQGSSMGQTPGAIFAFPALNRIIIHRPSNPPGGKDREIVVNLLNATNGIDCAKDVTLEFGDVVEIPMNDHPMNAPAVGLTSADSYAIANCIQGTVTLKFRGQSKEIHLDSTYRYLRSVVFNSEAQSLLLSSADLSRVKITRRDPATGKTRELVLDCRPSLDQSPNMLAIPQPLPPIGSPGVEPHRSADANNLWLRDGDVIEVPEK